MRSRGALLVAAALIAGCTASGARSTVASSTPTGPHAVDLTVFAAASLAGVVEDLTEAYEAASPGTTLTTSSDSSAALETQIEHGAPADVFLSADTANPKKLVDRGFSAGEAVVFATNRLTVVVPSDNPGGVASPADLARLGVKIIAAGDEVPITAYARQLVANLAKEPGYPAGFEAAYDANVVSREDNVKAVITKVEIGEGDAAIVYMTDAKASTGVRTIGVPDRANVTARYAGVVVGASADQEGARTFLAWLTGPDGQAILSSFGFLPPPS
ncbi:MAG TPA: molybdate ABC transporter substrate-binding protein [Candidatus Limnocylindrales bacterium]|jgi:molybdate transport system substrate-binding protein|nr:molybdate ABC transporter substrate-binding protein [Candidatus Limnocylindrales bacterium]